MSGKFDYSGMKELYEQTRQLMLNSDNFHRDFMNEMGNRCVAETKKRTPVGVYEKPVLFYARKDLNNPDKGIGLVELDGVGGGQGGTLRKNWQRSNPLKKGNTWNVDIFNNIEYASYVEHGHRVKGFNSSKFVGWFEGRHMARDAIGILQQEFASRYDREFQKYINRMGGGK